MDFHTDGHPISSPSSLHLHQRKLGPQFNHECMGTQVVSNDCLAVSWRPLSFAQHMFITPFWYRVPPRIMYPLGHRQAKDLSMIHIRLWHTYSDDYPWWVSVSASWFSARNEKGFMKAKHCLVSTLRRIAQRASIANRREGNMMEQIRQSIFISLSHPHATFCRIWFRMRLLLVQKTRREKNKKIVIRSRCCVCLYVTLTSLQRVMMSHRVTSTASRARSADIVYWILLAGRSPYPGVTSAEDNNLVSENSSLTLAKIRVHPFLLRARVYVRFYWKSVVKCPSPPHPCLDLWL